MPLLCRSFGTCTAPLAYCGMATDPKGLRPRSRTCSRSRARPSTLTLTLTHAHARSRSCTRTRRSRHAHTLSAHAHAHAHAHARTHAHAHAHAQDTHKPGAWPCLIGQTGYCRGSIRAARAAGPGGPQGMAAHAGVGQTGPTRVCAEAQQLGQERVHGQAGEVCEVAVAIVARLHAAEALGGSVQAGKRQHAQTQRQAGGPDPPVDVPGKRLQLRCVRACMRPRLRQTAFFPSCPHTQTESNTGRQVLVEGSPLDPVRVCSVDAQGGITEQIAAPGSHEACVHVPAGGWYAMGDQGSGASAESSWRHAVPSIKTNSVVFIFDIYCPVEDQARVLRVAAERAARHCKVQPARPRVGALELGNWIEYDTSSWTSSGSGTTSCCSSTGSWSRMQIAFWY